MRRSTVTLTLLIAFVLVTSLALKGCRRVPNVWPDNGKKRVLASFPPLFCFTKHIAGEDAEVRCLLAAQGPHDFKPGMNEVLLAEKADLILINGLELDEWVIKLLGKAGKAVPIMKVGEKIPEDQLRHLAENEAHHGHGHKHGEHDPHVWLGPPQVKLMVAAIATRLSELDPAHKDNYENRAKVYLQELDKLYEDGKSAFKGKKSRNIITTHDSMHYFAAAFDLKIVGHFQPRPGIEPDAKQLAALTKICRDNPNTVILTEPQFPAKQAQNLQQQLANQEVKIQLVEVDPLETAPLAANKTDPDPAHYLAQMKRNIDNLAKALP